MKEKILSGIYEVLTHMKSLCFPIGRYYYILTIIYLLFALSMERDGDEGINISDMRGFVSIMLILVLIFKGTLFLLDSKLTRENLIEFIPNLFYGISVYFYFSGMFAIAFIQSLWKYNNTEGLFYFLVACSLIVIITNALLGLWVRFINRKNKREVAN